MNDFTTFPPQQLSFSRKNKAWRKRHLDWADSRTFTHSSLVRKSVLHKKINYGLLNGKLYMSDLMAIINPDNIDAGFIPEEIQHYPIMNSKLNVLRGEESKRVFDYRVVVTNPNAVSEIEAAKKKELMMRIEALLADTAQSEEDFNQEIEKLGEYYNYEWQDMREVRGNALLNHYCKELNVNLMFNHGFMDAMAVAEEMYICDIVGGEPVIERLNPNKVRIYKSGASNKVEDADVIVIEDYWSPGKIIDTYYDVLTKKDMEYIEKMPDNLGRGAYDAMDNIDERYAFIPEGYLGEEPKSEFFFGEKAESSLLPYDDSGNIRVIRMFWKSRRKIKKVKSYDPITGDEVFNFYPETYITNTAMGEEEEVMWINEAWEGTKIGTDIYVNMRPRVVQYNRLSNPSRCHFGIVGSIYNLNESKPFSLVDMMKPYNYLYDVIHDRLNKIIARNWGKIIQLDLAKVPKEWTIDKWLYYAKTNNIAVTDSFKEGNIGAATGKLAGGLNNASSGVIDAETGNIIQLYINFLEFVKAEMSDVAGISKQREGQISNRETVGGVERATLQSTHITEWLFVQHEDVKRRALECLLETAKIALKGRKKKFQYILSDNSIKVMEIDGDEFAECDYGLIVDNSNSIQALQQKLDTLAQAALQNQTLNFSTIMKLYNSSSLAEKQRMVEKNERDLMQRQEQAQQQQMQQAQEQLQAQAQAKEADMAMRDTLNQRDNETRILVAEIEAASWQQKGSEQEKEIFSEEARAKLQESVRQFDERLKLDKDKLAFNKEKADSDAKLKERALNRKTANKNGK